MTRPTHGPTVSAVGRLHARRGREGATYSVDERHAGQLLLGEHVDHLLERGGVADGVPAVGARHVCSESSAMR